MTEKENVLTDEKLREVTGGTPELETCLSPKELAAILSGMEEKTCPTCGTKYIGFHECTDTGYTP